MDIKQTPENFHDWIPIRFYPQANRFLVDWCYIGKERFTDSFFDSTIERRFRKPFNLLFRHQTPVEFLGELNAASPGIAPTGFIFHLSRCGSTLISQMLAALPQNIVLSEPPPIDMILRANFKNPAVTDEQRIMWLKWMMNTFGQKRNAEEKHLFIKFDSWSSLDLSLIKQAFPGVPWIFLYRNPVEVIVSHTRQRGAQMIPGVVKQILPELDLIDAVQMPPEEYCARVLARICESALMNLPNRNARIVNYTQLPEAVTSTISEHFRVDYSSADVERMKNAARFNAKTPQMNFAADSEEKKNEASGAARQAAEKWVNPLYGKLETMRREFAG